MCAEKSQFARYLQKLQSCLACQNFLFEPTCAPRTVGSYASYSVCSLSVCHLTKNYWTIIHISKNNALRILKFDQSMDVDDPYLDL